MLKTLFFMVLSMKKSIVSNPLTLLMLVFPLMYVAYKSLSMDSNKLPVLGFNVSPLMPGL
jgi:hypothetical protein